MKDIRLLRIFFNMQYLAKVDESMCCNQRQDRQRPLLVAEHSMKKNAAYRRKKQ